MIQTEKMSLYSDSQTTTEFVNGLKRDNYFGTMRTNSRKFVLNLREKLNSIPTL